MISVCSLIALRRCRVFGRRSGPIWYECYFTIGCERNQRYVDGAWYQSNFTWAFFLARFVNLCILVQKIRSLDSRGNNLGYRPDYYVAPLLMQSGSTFTSRPRSSYLLSFIILVVGKISFFLKASWSNRPITWTFNSTIALHRGETLVITLSNAPTPYQWALRART